MLRSFYWVFTAAFLAGGRHTCSHTFARFPVGNYSAPTARDGLRPLFEESKIGKALLIALLVDKPTPSETSIYTSICQAPHSSFIITLLYQRPSS